MKEYKGLKALARSFRILGWISFVLALLSSCAAFIVPMTMTDDALTLGILGTMGFFGGPAIFVAGLAFSSSMFFASGIIELLIDISDYTFQTRELMRRALTKPREDNAYV